MKYYYLRFEPSANINYLNLFAFYDIADYRAETKVYDKIVYKSITELSNRIGLSASTISRILNNTEYHKFMQVDKKNKEIILNNSFVKGKPASFVRLTKKHIDLIREQKDNLLAKYIIYIKYYCGYSKTNTTDFTGKQFLQAFNYCISSTSYLNKLNAYNKLLQDRQVIKITQYRDELGHTRNKYYFI